MRLPDESAVLEALQCPNLTIGRDTRFEGRLQEVNTTLLRAYLPGVALGELCTLPNHQWAEVVALEGAQALLSPYGDAQGLHTGMWVRPSGQRAKVSVGPGLLGRVLDALGQPIDGLPAPVTEHSRDIEAAAPNPMQRAPIATPLPVGIRAIDGMLTVGLGQRLGIFAPAGCGKSTLLGMLCGGSAVDVVVIALIGERGREVRELLEHVLPASARSRSVVVVATSDRPALERIKAAATATTIAEYFRDQGRQVLLVMDSLTRYARAVREIALASGEPMVAGGYPPSLYARLPRLLERAGPAAVGSITAFYTVLMEDRADTLAEEVRSILDGHIVLSRKLAQASHFPAIDVLASVSRVMSQITAATHRSAAARVRQLLSTWQDIELLVRVGEYRAGSDADADEALRLRGAIHDWLRQALDEPSTFEQTLHALDRVVDRSC